MNSTGGISFSPNHKGKVRFIEVFLSLLTSFAPLREQEYPFILKIIEALKKVAHEGVMKKPMPCLIWQAR